MKARKTVSLLLILVLSLSLLTACGKAAAPAAPTAEPTTAPVADPTAEPAPAGVTVTDMMGREVTLAAPAQSVVALSAADCEILYAIGAGDLLIGRGEYCDWPAEVLDAPSVQSGYETNVEQLLALQPDVLLMSAMDQSAEQVQQLTDAGIAVVVSDADDIEGVYTSIQMIGALMGHDAQAAAVVAQMQDAFASVAAEAGENSGKTVYFEVSPLVYGLWTAGTGTFMDEIATLLGLTNAFADVEGWAEVSEEQVISRNPDYIVTISMYFGEGPTPTEEILARAGWQEVTAVKDAAILNLQNNELSRPGPRLAEGALALRDFVRDAAENAA